MPASDGQVTLLLTELREGNQEAANRLMPLVYSGCAEGGRRKTFWKIAGYVWRAGVLGG
jgi:hypothetical protein